MRYERARVCPCVQAEAQPQFPFSCAFSDPRVCAVQPAALPLPSLNPQLTALVRETDCTECGRLFCLWARLCGGCGAGARPRSENDSRRTTVYIMLFVVVGRAVVDACVHLHAVV